MCLASGVDFMIPRFQVILQPEVDEKARTFHSSHFVRLYNLHHRVGLALTNSQSIHDCSELDWSKVVWRGVTATTTACI